MFCGGPTGWPTTVADPEILKGGGVEDNVSAPSSFITNAHNEPYAFYTGKIDGLLEKKTEANNNKHETDQIVLTMTKALTKTTNCTSFRHR